MRRSSFKTGDRVPKMFSLFIFEVLRVSHLVVSEMVKVYLVAHLLLPTVTYLKKDKSKRKPSLLCIFRREFFEGVTIYCFH